MHTDLVDLIYEAAVVPERWDEALERIAGLLDAASGAMLVIDQRLPPLWAGTRNVHETLAGFAQSPGWYTNDRAARLKRFDHAGFLRLTDFSTEAEIKADLCMDFIPADLIQWQAGTAIMVPTGETVIYTIERAPGQRNFEPEELQTLDYLRPHLARAGLMAARMQLRQARDTVSAFALLGLPAAVVNGRGVVMACNEAFEALDVGVGISAFNRLAASDPRVNALVQEALAQSASEARLVRTIPVPARDAEQAPALIHVMPLIDAARDVFGAGVHVVLVSTYEAQAGVPATIILRALFDLTPAEARLAGDLASGMTLAASAGLRGISMATARTQLGQVFRKTATRQQSELVALLKGAVVVPG